MKNKSTQKRFVPKVNIKKGDKVVVIAGSNKDRSKILEVLEVLPHENRAVLEGTNVVKRHTKPSASNPDGGIVEKPAPIHISNLMIVDPKSKEPTRVGRKIENGKSVRYSKKSGEIL